MKTLASRTRTRPTNRRPKSPRSCVPAPGVSRAVVVSLKFPPPALRGRLHDLLLVRVPLEARLGLEVAVHRVWCYEDEARVGLCRPRDPAGDVVEVELHDGEEALQIGLLINGEVYVLGSHELEGLRQEVVAAGLDSLVVQAELFHHLGHALGYPRARCDLLDLYVRPGVLYGLLRAVDARLDVELARRRYKERYEPLVDEANNPLSHLDARLKEVLADVRERGVRPWPLAIGVVGDHRDAVVQGLLDRVVEG